MATGVDNDTNAHRKNPRKHRQFCEPGQIDFPEVTIAGGCKSMSRPAKNVWGANLSSEKLQHESHRILRVFVPNFPEILELCLGKSKWGHSNGVLVLNCPQLPALVIVCLDRRKCAFQNRTRACRNTRLKNASVPGLFEALVDSVLVRFEHARVEQMRLNIRLQ